MLSPDGLAESIAADCGAKGAIIITFGVDAIPNGTEGPTPVAVREALCQLLRFCLFLQAR